MNSEFGHGDFGTDPHGDAADQADRLTTIMVNEALVNEEMGSPGEGSTLGLDLPLEDTEALVELEDAEDASDDPLHAGGYGSDSWAREEWVPAEIAAMHIIDPNQAGPGAVTDGSPVFESTEGGSVEGGRSEGLSHDLTPEDQTLLGIDPYGPDVARR